MVSIERRMVSTEIVVGINVCSHPNNDCFAGMFCTSKEAITGENKHCVYHTRALPKLYFYGR